MSDTQTLPHSLCIDSPRNPSRRINARLIAFLGTVAIVVGSILSFSWTTIAMALSGGIREGRDGKMVDLRALGYFVMDPKEGTLNNVPRRFRELDGQRVVMEGFMYGGNSVYEPRDYEFVYDIQKCCFGGPPLVQERVFVHVPKGRTVPFFPYTQCVRMVGILHVKVEKKEGIIERLYTLDAEKAEAL